MPYMEESVGKGIDHGRTALYLVMDSIRADSTRKEIRELLTAVTFMKRAFLELHRSDLIKKLEIARIKLMSFLLINWEWLDSYKTAQYLPPEAYEDIKELYKKLLEIEALRMLLIDMLLDAGIHLEVEESIELPTIGG